MLHSAEKLLQNFEIKKLLEEYAQKYDTVDFIKNDPSKFVHIFNNQSDIETAGFIASLFSYGKRDLFIKLLDSFLYPNHNLTDFIKNFDPKYPIEFNYRFSKTIDFSQILLILKNLFSQNETLGSLYKYYYSENNTISGMLQGVTEYFYSNITLDVTKGFYHLIPNPANGGAMKRMNMMLRWFVRKSAVDVGIWNFIDKSELIIPLDVHVGNISRQIGLLSRKNNDMKSALEITENLKLFDSKDPIKYDFALFGIGVNNISLNQ